MSNDREPAAPAKPAKGLNDPATRRKLVIGLAVVAVVLLAYGLRWWFHGRFVQSTNDAYLQADQVTIAPKVQGYVEQVFVGDNQAVAVGDPLVKIDTSNYDAALAQQRAALSARRADLTSAERQVAQQHAAVDQMQAQLSGAQATLTYATSEAERYRSLSDQGVETRERFAQAKNQADQAAASVRADTAALQQAERQVATLEAQVGQAQAQITASEAEVKTAEINLGDTVLRAGIAGRIGDKSVRVGQFVQPGTRLMSIVPVADVYLVANFKETQIGQMKIGQRATVSVDALDGREIDAVLDSFAPGTGAEFALLPPQNATGNFTKIVQRVPVRFRLKPPPEIQDRLLPGLSVTVEIDTAKPPVKQP